MNREMRGGAECWHVCLIEYDFGTETLYTVRVFELK
jgi:hypothetical protein